MNRWPGIILTAAICGCSPLPQAEGPEYGSEQIISQTPELTRHEADDLPVIVHIESRARTITAKASPIGPVYSITDREGRVIVANQTLKQLHASHPDLHRKIKGAYAGEADNLMWIDASVDAGYSYDRQAPGSLSR